MTSRSHPSSRSASSAVVIAAIGAASATMNPIRAVRQRRVDRQIGRPGLEHRQNRHDRLGRPGQQQRHTLSRARTLAGQQVRQPVCRLLELAVGPRVAPRSVSATASGVRATCAANNTGIDTGAVAGWVNTARLPHPSSRACSPASSTSTDDSRRVGSVVIATNTRRNRSISVSMLAASNTSVRNSTAPPIPAGSPASLHCSASENVRSMRAVWVSAGSGVTCRSPNANPAAGSLVCPGRFCQANITCTSG